MTFQLRKKLTTQRTHIQKIWLDFKIYNPILYNKLGGSVGRPFSFFATQKIYILKNFQNFNRVAISSWLEYLS